jgi:hypothetical protein
VQKKYLEIIKYETNTCAIPKYQYAFLIDRISVSEGKKQIYGTQVDVSGKKPKPFPVINPKKLNERRISFGLGSIEDYLLLFNQYTN